MLGRCAVVLGGGVIGCSTAWHLARSRCFDAIHLVEHQQIASGATSRAAGLLTHVTSHPLKVRLVQQTLEDVKLLETQLGESIGFRRVGTLRIAVSEARRQELQAEAKVSSSEGVELEWLTTESSVRELVPWLRLPTGGVGLFSPADGYVDPAVLAGAYARAAVELGVKLELHTTALEVQPGEGDVRVELQGAAGQRTLQVLLQVTTYYSLLATDYLLSAAHCCRRATSSTPEACGAAL